VEVKRPQYRQQGTHQNVMVIRRTFGLASVSSSKFSLGVLPMIVPARWVSANTAAVLLGALEDSRQVPSGMEHLAARAKLHWLLGESDRARSCQVVDRYYKAVAASTPNQIVVWAYCLAHALHLVNGEALLVADPKSATK
jgi:hypothetical protein